METVENDRIQGKISIVHLVLVFWQCCWPSYVDGIQGEVQDGKWNSFDSWNNFKQDYISGFERGFTFIQIYYLEHSEKG
jgi:hypothetical protein